VTVVAVVVEYEDAAAARAAAAVGIGALVVVAAAAAAAAADADRSVEGERGEKWQPVDGAVGAMVVRAAAVFAVAVGPEPATPASLSLLQILMGLQHQAHLPAASLAPAKGLPCVPCAADPPLGRCPRRR